MRLALFCCAFMLSAASLAAESKVYLVATVTLGGSNLSSSIFLYEPEITDLQSCTQAAQQGQQRGDWLRYHHILRRDKMKGFTAQTSYRCVNAELDIETWYDKDRYDYAYLVSVDAEAKLQVKPAVDLSACHTLLNKLSAAQQAQSFCAKGNQRIGQ